MLSAKKVTIELSVIYLASEKTLSLELQPGMKYIRLRSFREKLES